MRKFLNLFPLVLLLCLVALIGGSSASAAVSTPPALAQQPPACVLFGDFNEDGEIDVVDIMQVANKWHCKCGEECYDPLYDTDSDCVINIVDIMRIAVRWGGSCENPLPPIEVCGSISEDTTWRMGNVYLVTCDVTVNSGVTLTVERGVVVKFADDYTDIRVYGTLVAQGTDIDRVVFTSLKDDTYGGDTNGDGSASTPAAGDWGVLKFSAGASGVFDQAVVSYGGYGYYSWGWYGTRSMIDVINATATISNTVVDSSRTTGIYVEGEGASLGLTDSTISNNNASASDDAYGGLYYNVPGGQPRFSGNTFSGNKRYGLYVTGADSPIVEDSVVRDTVGNSGKGDGIYFATVTSPTIRSTSFISNSRYAAHVRMTNGTFTNEGNGGSGNGYNGFALAGTLSGDTTLSAAPGFAYIVPQYSDLSVSAVATLTISPGVVVKFADQYAGLQVYGTLIAQGTGTDKVIFTSLKDDTYGGDTNGDGSASTPAAGDWRALKFSSGANGVFDQAVVSYGGYGYYNYGWYGTRSMVDVISATVTISNTVVDSSYTTGIYIEGAGASLQVTDSTISNNNASASDDAYGGLHYDVPGGQPRFSGNTFSGNKRFGFYITGADSPIVEDSVIRDTEQGAYTLYADGLYFYGVTSPTIRNTSFVNNGRYAAYAEHTNGTFTNEGNNGSGNGYGYNGFAVASILSGDTTLLPAPGFPYIVPWDLSVSAGVTLTVSPGVVVKFADQYADIQVNGTLVAQGTDTDKVVFTSLKDDAYGGDTNDDGSASTPTAGDWGALKFSSGANGVFEQAVISYGGYGSYNYGWTGTRSMIDVISATVTISNTVVDNSYTTGIYVEGEGASLGLTNSTISNNNASASDDAYGGLHYDVPGGQPRFSGNTFSGNKRFGFYITGADSPIVEDSVIRDTEQGAYTLYADGLYFYGVTSPTIRNTSFVDNGRYAAYAEHTNGTFTNEGNNGSGNGYGYNGFAVASTLSGDTILLPAPGFPYIVPRHGLSVSAGVTLTVSPGAVVKFADYAADLWVYGALIAQGTDTDKVVFTSLKDDTYGGDTNGDGSASTPAAGDWGALKFTSGANGVFDQAVVSYGGYGWYHYGWYGTRSMVDVISATVTISNTVVDSSYTTGVYVEGAGASLGLTNSTISNNNASASDDAYGGVYYDVPGGQPRFNGNTISGNKRFGLYITGADSPVVEDSVIRDTEQGSGTLYADGLYFYGVTSPTIRNTSFINNARYAAYAEHFHGTVTNEGNSGSGNGYGYNGFAVASTLSGDTTLLAAPGFAYIVPRRGLSVSAGVTLTVSPGAVVKFADDDADLWVYGALIAQGTDTDKVVFTSLKDDTYGGDTNGDGSASTPSAGDWGVLQFRNGANGIFDQAVVSYGGYGYYSYGWYGTRSMVDVTSATVTISNTVVDSSRTTGIYIEGEGASLQVTDSTISNNASYTSHTYGGIYYYGSDSASIHNSSIYGNHSYSIYNANTSATINAENNWWGHESGPVPYGSGNGINYTTSCSDGVCTIIPYVDVIPWLGQQTYYGQNVPNVVYEADPVNTANGNYAYQHTGLSISTRGLPLAFTRAYNSLSAESGPLSYGWRHNWLVTAEENGDDVHITYGDGRQIRFTWDSSAYVPAAGVFSVLTKTNGVFHLTEKDQTTYHFDDQGRLDSVEDKNGNTTILNYDPQGHLTTVTGPASRTLTFTYASPVSPTLISRITDHTSRTLGFTYNITGELTVVTDTLGYITTYTYDGDHRLLSITDANGHTFVTNEYNSAGRVVKQWDANGNQWTFAYDEPDHETTVTDPLGRTTTYQYDNKYRLLSEKDPLNFTISYTYDGQNNRTSVTDKRGNTTTYAYDERGNTTVVTDTLGYTTTLTYDAQNNLTSETDAQGYTTNYVYDANGNLTSTTDPLGNTITFAYDGYGQMTSTTDANGNTTQFGYNTYGYQTAITDALGNATTFTYDIAGRRLSETDALGRSTSYTYDLANRMLTISEPLGKVTAYTYDPVGNRISIIDPRSGVTSFTYDEKDRLVSVSDPLGHTTTYGYDAVNNQTVITDALGHATTYAYDALNRRTSVTDPLGNTTSYGYDANGNRTSLTDANSNVTQYSYDALNCLISVTDAEGGTVTYAYDAVGNRKAMTDANSHTTTYEYDPLNRLVSVTDPLSYTVAYAYDAVGNRTGRTKADDTVISYDYDALDRLVDISAPGLSTSYAYDAVGNRTTMTDTVDVTSYTYDDLNRLTQAAGPNGTLSYSYDLNDNRTNLTYPDSKVVAYTYDVADRLTAVTDWDSRVTAYTYDDANRQTAVQYPNNTQATYTYDDADRLLSIVHTSPVSGTIAVFTYTLDAVGNRLTMQDLEGATTYAYDDLYRLTQVTYPDGETVTYAYDAMGNRTAMTSTVSGAVTYTYDAADRLLTISDGTTFTWDVNGNMIGKGSATYIFDALDRLTQVVSSTTTVQFTYDGDGVRLSKTVNGSATDYVQDVAAPLPVVLAETTTGQTSRYVYGNDLLAQVDPAGNPSFYHSDGLGSTRALSNLAGQRTDAYSYDVFGLVRSHTGGTSQAFTFTGEQVDDELGLVYLRARYYDPALGRFVSRDRFLGQFTKTNGLNPYVYALNRPNTETDPEGLFSWPDSFGSYAQASLKLGPIGLSLALDIDVPAAEFRLSLNFIGRLLPKQTDLTLRAKAVAGFYAGSAGETSLGVDAFYGQGLIAGGSVSRGFGNKVKIYAGVGGGSPVKVGGSQRLWQWRLQAENTTFQRAVGTAMPFVPIARWAIVKLTAPDLDWLNAWNLANPAFEIPGGQALGVSTAYASSPGDNWGGPPSGGK